MSLSGRNERAGVCPALRDQISDSCSWIQKRRRDGRGRIEWNLGGGICDWWKRSIE